MNKFMKIFVPAMLTSGAVYAATQYPTMYASFCGVPGVI